MALHPGVPETNTESNVIDRVGRFHRRQAWSVLVVFAVLVGIFLVMLTKQYTLGQQHENERLLRHFTERVAYLENLLTMITEHVEGMRLVAEADLLGTRAGQTLNQPIEFGDLTDASNASGYNLDTFKPPITREMIGNLTGEGSLQGRDHAFYRELHMALTLNPQFHVIANSVKNAAWVYYTSKNNFINIYPWISSKDFRYSRELKTHEFYTLGLPENNPDRKRFWTKVYVDEFGKGLMTTSAAPIYDQDRFLGTVAIDLTVDFLNSVVQEFSPHDGVMYIINSQDQLLSHPGLITSKDQLAKPLAAVLPEELRGSIPRLKQIPDNEFTRMGSFEILSSHLKQAPWTVVFLRPVHPFLNSLTAVIGLGPLIVLVLLLFLVVGVLVLTERQFVSPSNKFVNYIMDRSQRAKTPIDKGLPEVWKPWFAAVEKVFTENDNLSQELRKHNEELEARVKQRTAELEKEVEGRKQVQETLRRSEERFREMSELLPSTIVELDSNFKISYMNQLGLKLFGYDSHDIAAGIYGFDLIHPDHRDDAINLLAKSSECKNLVEAEYRVLQKGQDSAWALFKAAPVYQNEKIVGFRVVLNDISTHKHIEKQRELLITELQDALAEIKQLRGFLPICSVCKKIRDDEGYWQQVEEYIQDRTDAQFSHSICPGCAGLKVVSPVLPGPYLRVFKLVILTI